MGTSKDDMMTHEQWLEQNTFACERMNGRLTKGACLKVQQRNANYVCQINGARIEMIIPGRCSGCVRMVSPDNIKAHVSFREKVASNVGENMARKKAREGKKIKKGDDHGT